MRSNSLLVKIGFFLLAGMFCFFILNLFLLRFKTGDIYPRYSSLRSDPLGTRALFDALSGLKNINVTRNYSSAYQLTDHHDNCIFFLGIPFEKYHFVSKEEYGQIEDMVTSGARLIISLRTLHQAPFEKTIKKSMEKKQTDEKDGKDLNHKDKNKKKENDEELLCKKTIKLFQKTGLIVHFENNDQVNGMAHSHQPLRSMGFVNPVSWPFKLWFEPEGEDWKTILSVNTKPVVVEKKWGKGSILVAADSYIFSNESLKYNTDRHLLAWLCGTKKNIIFDEFHLGVQKHPGIATLIKRYNLSASVILFCGLIILFVWKNSSSLIPPDEENEMYAILDDEQLKPNDNFSGLANLLGHHIAKKDLINQCREAWKSAFVKDNKASEKHKQLYEKICIEDRRKSSKSKPIDKYIHICRIIAEKEIK